MVLLIGVVECLGLGSRLHREAYEFEITSTQSPNKLGKRASGRVVELSPSIRYEEPRQYWLIGFKDRNLEREYLEDLVDANSVRFVVGTFLSLVLFTTFALVYHALAAGTIVADGALSSSSDNLWFYVVAMITPFVGFLVAFALCFAVRFCWGRVSKRSALCSIQSAYLVYICATTPLLVVSFLNENEFIDDDLVIRLGYVLFLLSLSLSLGAMD